MAFVVFSNQIRENTINTYVLKSVQSEEATKKAWQFIDNSVGLAQVIRELDGENVQSIGQVMVILQHKLPQHNVNLSYLGSVNQEEPRFSLLIDTIEIGVVMRECYLFTQHYISFDHMHSSGL